jgi:hypothetical protein
MNREEHQGLETSRKAKWDLGREVLCSFGELRFAATGWSMLPSIWPGETLVVECVSPEQICIGDVILTEREGGLRAHRVISMARGAQNRQWTTQGDALSVPDPPVNETELLGRVAYLIRDGKCMTVPAQLSTVESLLAKIVQRSVPAARALVYLNRKRQS